MGKSKLAVAQPAKPKDLDGDGKIEEWEIEQALGDLERAEKHKSNPKLMKKVAKLAGRKVKALKGITSIQDLRDLRNKQFEPKE